MRVVNIWPFEQKGHLIGRAAIQLRLTLLGVHKGRIELGFLLLLIVSTVGVVDFFALISRLAG